MNLLIDGEKHSNAPPLCHPHSTITRQLWPQLPLRMMWSNALKAAVAPAPIEMMICL